jgi:hypothetical protein
MAAAKGKIEPFPHTSPNASWSLWHQVKRFSKLITILSQLTILDSWL